MPAFCIQLERNELSTTRLTIAEMLLRCVWFIGGWGTLVGVMVSVTLAIEMGKYEYCSKGAGFHCHGSSNLGAPMDGAQCVGALGQLCSGASNQRKMAKGPGYDVPPMLFALL